MLFNSIQFAFFFPIVTVLFFLLPHRFRWFLLLMASCFFYMFFKPVYILILVFTIVIDYFAGIWIFAAQGEKKKKLLLTLSIVANVGVLAVFKYYNFVTTNINIVLHSFHYNGSIPLLNILLPIGLSFHTFQAMSYTIEVYKGNQQPEKHFGIYALYVMFYPQLVAGPIERPQNIIHQFHEEKKFSYENARSGMIQIAWGLFKKVVVADRLGLFVNQVYGNLSNYKGIPLIMGAILFAFQIYNDFSGYSDIALGSAKVMGYDLMKNFDRPFVSKSISEYWRRWHISLSTWFNDYLYTPILINKRNWGKAAVVFGLFVTFFISGLWHGAGWAFIVWGLLHAIAVSYEFLTRKFRKQLAKKLPQFIYNKFCQLLTFIFLCFAWIFFRAKSISDALYFVRNLFSGIPPQVKDIIANRHFARLNLVYLNQSINELIIAILALVFMGIVQNAQNKSRIDEWLTSKPMYIRWPFYYGLVLAFVALGIFNRSYFIYFQF